MRSPETSWIELLIMLRDKFVAQLGTASMIKTGVLIRECDLAVLEKPAARVRTGAADPSKKRFVS